MIIVRIIHCNKLGLLSRADHISHFLSLSIFRFLRFFPLNGLFNLLIFFFFSLRGTRPEIAHYWFGCIILTSFWNTRTVMKFSIYYLNVVFRFTLIPLKLHVFIKFFHILALVTDFAAKLSFCSFQCDESREERGERDRRGWQARGTILIYAFDHLKAQNWSRQFCMPTQRPFWHQLTA